VLWPHRGEANAWLGTGWLISPPGRPARRKAAYRRGCGV
jgi:hypothetical protein